jgi:hypothetical protein
MARARLSKAGTTASEACQAGESAGRTHRAPGKSLRGSGEGHSYFVAIGYSHCQVSAKQGAARGSVTQLQPSGHHPCTETSNLGRHVATPPRHILPSRRQAARGTVGAVHDVVVAPQLWHISQQVELPVGVLASDPAVVNRSLGPPSFRGWTIAVRLP